MRTIIFTNSHDVTTDWLIQKVNNYSENIFRFNFDLFSDYVLNLYPDRFSLTDPCGRTILDTDIVKAYYRKPTLRNTGLAAEDFLEAENWAAYRSLVYYLWEANKLVLVEPFTEKTRLNKLRQLRYARNFFTTPETVFTNQIQKDLLKSLTVVCKSLTGGNIGDRTLYSNKVQTNTLDPSYSWYIQDYVDSRYDVTVVYVQGKMFPFILERIFLAETIDFRAPDDPSIWEQWQLYSLNPNDQTKIRQLMELFQLDFGRLDFLLNKDGDLVFCEVNPNGQFAWLDSKDSVGLLSAVADCIDPQTPVRPIPHYPFGSH